MTTKDSLKVNSGDMLFLEYISNLNDVLWSGNTRDIANSDTDGMNNVFLLSTYFWREIENNRTNKTNSTISERYSEIILKFRSDYQLRFYRGKHFNKEEKETRNIILKRLSASLLRSINYMITNAEGYNSVDSSGIENFEYALQQELTYRLKDIYSVLTVIDNITSFTELIVNSRNVENFEMLLLSVNSYKHNNEKRADSAYAERITPLNCEKEIFVIKEYCKKSNILLFIIQDATREDLYVCITRLAPNYFHYIGHSKEEGLILRTKTIFCYKELIILECVSKLIFLNSCLSSNFEDYFMSNNTSLITYSQPLSNSIGTEFANLFYNGLDDLINKRNISLSFSSSTDVIMYSSLLQQEQYIEYIRKKTGTADEESLRNTTQRLLNYYRLK